LDVFTQYDADRRFPWTKRKLGHSQLTVENDSQRREAIGLKDVGDCLDGFKKPYEGAMVDGTRAELF
jgi:hypothetical protein